MEESLLQILLTLLLVKLIFLLFSFHLIPSLWLFLWSKLQTLQVPAREKSFVKSVVSGQPHYEASGKFSPKSRLSWTWRICDPVFSYLLFFLRGKRPERISKRSNDEEFYVKVKFFRLHKAAICSKGSIFFPTLSRITQIADNTKRGADP